METMNLIRQLCNHAATSQTEDYIGLSEKVLNSYYNDFSKTWDEFVIRGKEENCK